MKKEDLRKVKISEYEDGSGEHITNGYFHKWIEETWVSESGLMKSNYGLVEMEDGVVKVFKVNRIKFVEEF